MQKSMFTKHGHFQFECYCAFANAIKILLLGLFKGFIMHIQQNPP